MISRRTPRDAPRVLWLAVFLAGLFLAVPASACLWDYDTLLMERSRFPDTLELITGKFRRHSTEFYAWRIEDRLQKLEKEPENLAWLDDLGVAYDKTGQHAKAVETMQRKEAIRPGLYETAANRGTFLIHSGNFEEGLVHIRRAIEINPDAHFGREVYQQRLVEYVLESRSRGRTGLPLRDLETERGFVEFLSGATLSGNESKIDWIDAAEARKALKGVLGMMRFGHHDSPVLLEALGDLLSFRAMDDGKRLAARAYLKASYEADDEAARKAYRTLARQALNMQTIHPATTSELTVEPLEATFRVELSEAREWYEQLEADELRWIREGKDADAEFARKYFAEPTVSDSSWRTWVNLLWDPWLASGLALVALVAAFVIFRRRRRGKRSI